MNFEENQKQEKMNKTGLLFRYSVLFSGIFIITGCSSTNNNTDTKREISVKTTTAYASPASFSNDYVGVTEEESSALLSFPVQGKIERLFVSEGQQVSEGKVLAELSSENLQSTYQAARASLSQAEDAMKRLQMLYDNQSLPEMKYVEAQSKLEQAQAMEQVARKNLEESRLKAPFSGVIGTKSVEEGENILPNQPIFSLLKTNTVKIKIAVPENEIAKIHTGENAIVTVAALGGRSYQGKITDKGVIANPVSHTYEAKITLANPDRALMPGMICRVQLHAGDTASSIILPNNVIQINSEGEQFVWGVEGGKAAIRFVKTGVLTDKGVTIESGLNAGDTVIVEGQQKVSEGMKVNIL